MYLIIVANKLWILNLGPIHMIPVDQDNPVTEISVDSYFLCKKFDVFIWEGEPAWLMRSWFLGNLGMRIFPYEHFILVTGMKKNSNTIIHFHDRRDNT